jgi:acyl transferase domain-containing protein/pimeloyl-ACP methyl ester carboxylesterase
MKNNEHFDENNSFGIAIIGMAGRFPGATNIGKFWQNLKDGIESVRALTAEELASSGVDDSTKKNARFVNAGAPMPDADAFDADFFSINTREAEIIDPQHRILLETAWEALEDAGYDPERYRGSIGVFAGVGPNTYLLKNLATRPDLMQLLGRYAILLASEKEYAVTRISFKLNLTGPSYTVNTACSTSGVTIHVACQSLLSGECDIALAGGGRVHVPLTSGYMYEEGGILSPDGHCRAFDAEASGTVGGSGVGIVVLKRLSEAIEEGDNIYAVIKGSAINNDGSQKIGFTAPSIPGQAAVISEALAMAGINPETIGYVETHGTGTSLGDPIEIAALTEAYRKWTDRKVYCPIGSVKTNIGHLDAGAGVAGVIKAALTLKHGEIPPSLHFVKPNPEIDFENSPFYVNTQLSPWLTGAAPRRAGVSSFGLGGTNAHIVLEEAPRTELISSSRNYQLLLLSAKSDSALTKVTQNLTYHLEKGQVDNLGDIAYTLQTGRQAMDHRRMVVCHDTDDALSALDPINPKRVFTSIHKPTEREIAFMFSGQGSQYVNMGLELYRNESTFTQVVDYCSGILKTHLSEDLIQILYPDESILEDASRKLQQTALTQPALFMIEYALAKLWMEWGLLPSAMVGHSIGEYVAACLAGVFSLEDALALVTDRGRLMQDLPSGSMLAVSLSQKEIESYLDGNLDLAVINAPSMCVVSGDGNAVDVLESELAVEGVGFRRLYTSHAFHSQMMEPILEDFSDRVGSVKLNSPKIPFLSNVTGTWISSDEATNPSYWASHLRQTVRFSDCLDELLKEPNRILLEVGPGRTLAMLAKQHPRKEREHVVLSSTRHPKGQMSDVAFMLNTLGHIWLAGIDISWTNFYKSEKRRRVSLPTYPFQRRHYWISPAETADAGRVMTITAPQVATEVAPDDSAQMEHTTAIAVEGAPRDSVEQSIAKIWQDLIGVDQVRYYDDFFEMGGSSLLALRLFSQIDQKFGKNLPLSTLFEAPTVEQLADLIRDEDREIPWSTLVEIKPGTSRPPLFLVHAAGGNILIYRDLAYHLDPDQPVYGLQAQGLDGEQPFLTTIEEMADRYLKDIQAVESDGPYLLGGYCMGGTVALEIAKQLREQGKEVVMLAIFETYNWINRPPKTWGDKVLENFQKLEFHLRNFLLLDFAGKKQFLYEKLKVLRGRSGIWYGMVLSKLGRKFQKRSGQHVPLAQLWDINESAPFYYNPGIYSGQITNFLPVKEYATNLGPGMDWDEVASAGVDTYRMAVYPAGMMVVPFVQQLAGKVQECIYRSLETHYQLPE